METLARSFELRGTGKENTMTAICDGCGRQVGIHALTTMDAQEICGQCIWEAGSEKEAAKCGKPESVRVSRNDAERKAHVGFWAGR